MNKRQAFCAKALAVIAILSFVSAAAKIALTAATVPFMAAGWGRLLELQECTICAAVSLFSGTAAAVTRAKAKREGENAIAPTLGLISVTLFAALIFIVDFSGWAAVIAVLVLGIAAALAGTVIGFLDKRNVGNYKGTVFPIIGLLLYGVIFVMLFRI